MIDKLKLTHSYLDEIFKKSDGLKSVNLVNNSCLQFSVCQSIV